MNEMLENKSKIAVFWQRVSKTKSCWNWIGCSGGYKNRYGVFNLKINGKFLNRYCHRISYMIHKGDIGDKFVCHKCDNPKCVNPDHLFLGTHDDNMKDMVAKGRSNIGSNNGMSKLTIDKVRTIRNLINNGKSTHEVAKKFGVRASAISRIANYKRWSALK